MAVFQRSADPAVLVLGKLDGFLDILGIETIALFELVDDIEAGEFLGCSSAVSPLTLRLNQLTGSRIFFKIEMTSIAVHPASETSKRSLGRGP